MKRMKHDIGKRKWHRVFGWGKITHPYTDQGKTLFDSERKHVRHYVAGKGWIDYNGTGKDGCIVSIFLHKSELFDVEMNDEVQARLKPLIEVIE